jgi:hypothetical protein
LGVLGAVSDYAKWWALTRVGKTRVVLADIVTLAACGIEQSLLTVGHAEG